MELPIRTKANISSCTSKVRSTLPIFVLQLIFSYQSQNLNGAVH
jgi:hypothetical protein